MNNKYTYEVTDTGQYFYENNVRIFPDQFWQIIKKLEHKIEELDFELKECKERKLYSRRELERENEQLKNENKELKAKVDDKEVAVEVECEKLMQKVFDLIEEKIKHYQKQSVLAVRIPINCEHKKSCLHNHEVNVCNKAKENAYRELKKELSECMN